ncbi:MAG: DNA alkylation repair protein [bacterium]
MKSDVIVERLKSLANPKDAKNLQWYFKTGPGEYGEGDVFIGIRVPAIRRLVKEYKAVDERTILGLLASPIHEARLLALLILVRQFDFETPSARARIYRFYLAHTDRINNWDLVDLSAPTIVGGYLLERSHRPLFRLAKSKSLWERRVAVLATFAFIRCNSFDDSLSLADLLLHDRHDLIHKAVGWMLREVGKRDQAVLESFLAPRCRDMPRTMLRYAIEKFSEAMRSKYMGRCSLCSML